MEKTKQMESKQIDGIYILKEGDTPWNYKSDPGYFEGPFINREEAFECRDLDGDLEVVEYWDRGDNGLWVTTRARR